MLNLSITTYQGALYELEHEINWSNDLFEKRVKKQFKCFMRIYVTFNLRIRKFDLHIIMKINIMVIYLS